MATNYSPPGREYPSRKDVLEMERDDRRRDREYAQEQKRIDAYLRNNPSASYAEAEYKTRGE